jgi:hypothetical protein
VGARNTQFDLGAGSGGAPSTQLRTDRVPGLVLKNFELVAIVPGQPILCAEPYETLIVLHDLGYLRADLT